MAAKRKKPAPKAASKRVARPKAKGATAKRPTAKLKLKTAAAKTTIKASRTKGKLKGVKAKAPALKVAAVKSRTAVKAAPKQAAPVRTAASPRDNVSATKAAARMLPPRVGGQEPRPLDGSNEMHAGVATGAVSARPAVSTEPESGSPSAVPGEVDADQKGPAPGLPVPIASFTI